MDFPIDRLKQIQDSIMDINGKTPKIQRIVNKLQDLTNKCTDEMAEVQQSVQDAQQLAASADKLVSKFMVNAFYERCARK